jgi:hypothetical protein
VDYVSWDNVTEFCRKLSQKDERTYRLPTEAEWEYGCRAGIVTAFQFGGGLGRIYKVLVDLLSVKTIVAFSSRPLLWFTLLSLPFAFAAIVCIAISFANFASGSELSLPIAGSGVLLGSLSMFLVLNGALAELVYKTGDVRVSSLANLTVSAE